MEKNNAIIVTGTSTGIGKACALHLDRMGYEVYACVRKSQDGDALKQEASDRLRPIVVDVTDSKSIDAAVKIIDEETGGNLYGLVNNAGIGRGGPLEVIPVEEIRKVFEVNVIGLMAMTQAFIPMLRKAKGRIINIGSTSSYLSTPGSSIYSASKFAVRAFTDALRLELKHFDIHVALVSPGAVESAIWEKGENFKKEQFRGIKPEIAKLYAVLIRFGEKLSKEIKRIPADRVAQVVSKALTTRKPKRYYIVGKDAKGAAKVAKLPRPLVDRLIYKRMQTMG